MSEERCPICDSDPCTCDKLYEYYEPTTADLDDDDDSV